MYEHETIAENNSSLEQLPQHLLTAGKTLIVHSVKYKSDDIFTCYSQTVIL
jgi:hypothetical protein